MRFTTPPPTRRHLISLKVQSRDVDLLTLLLNHFSLLTRRQISELYPERGIRRTNRRLRSLIAAGYLSQRIPTTYLIQEIPLYYVGPRAYEALDLEPRDPRILARRKQAAHLRERALPHFVLTNAVHIKFLMAEHCVPNYKLLSWISAEDGIWNQLAEFGFAPRPDAYIEYRKDDVQFSVFLELDRATERAPRLHDKLGAYNDYALSGSFQHQFAADRFRVLFIPPTARRREYLLRAMNSSTPGLFFCTEFQEFFSKPLFDAQWRSNESDIFLSLSTPL